MPIQKKPDAAVLHTSSPAAFSNAYENLTAAVVSRCGADHCIMVTSPGDNEGAAAVAVNLALSLADTGARVVLVDCDLRREMVQTCLPVNSPAQTVAALLEGDGPMDPAPVCQQSLYILPAGVPAAKPAALLGSPRMAQLLDGLRRHYDYVICAAPPVCLVPDGEVLGKLCGGTVLAVRHRFTHRRAVSDAVRRLEYAGVPLMGTVLTDLDLTMARKMGHPYICYDRK